MQWKKGLVVLFVLSALLAASPLATAQFGPCVQSGGFTRTVSVSAAGGTFVPPQKDVAETFYSYPGIGACGPYPGFGYAYDYGVGFTPYGYMPYGGFTYL